MNWLQDTISKFSVQGLAVVGLAYFRDIGKGGVRTVTITNRDGEVTPVALNEDYNGYIRAINNANYRLREAIDCTANLYDVEQDVAIVMWLDRKVNPNGVMVAIQQAVAGNDILNTSFDKQVILNEEGLPENDYIMMKVVVRMVSEYAGSSCPADVCAVYYDPCFEVPNRPEPSAGCDCECTVESGECCDYEVTDIGISTDYCVTYDLSNIGWGDTGDFTQFILSAVYGIGDNHTFFNITEGIIGTSQPTTSQLIAKAEELFDDDGGRWTYVFDGNSLTICDTNFTAQEIAQISFAGSGYSPKPVISITSNFTTQTFLTIQGELHNTTIVENEFSFQVNIDSEWATQEVIDGTWTSINDCRVITDWRIIDGEGNVIVDGQVTKTNCTPNEQTKTICEWITDHEERITALEEVGGVLTCETLQECEVIGNLEDRITDIEEAGYITCETLEDCSAFTYVKDLAESAVQPDDLALYVPYTGATADVNLGDNQLTTDAVTFDATPTTAAGERVLRWNDTDGTLDLGMKGGNVTQQIGMEQYIHAKSSTNSGIAEGYIYYLAGAIGGNQLVALAQANSPLTSKSTIGIATETKSGGNKAFITTFGLVRALPDALFTSVNEGDTLYLSATTPGTFQNTAPTQPNHRIRIGYCVRKQSNNNEIFVSVQLGLDLGELCNVYAPTPANGYFPSWVAANSRYELQEPKFRLFADFANTSVNTNTTNNVIGVVLIPANTVTNNTVLEIESWISRANGGANGLHRLFINTSNAFAGATEVARITTTTTSIFSKGERTFVCKTGQMRGFNATTTSALDDLTTTVAPTTTSVDWTIDQYILTVANNATGETTTHELTSVKVIKP